ncbi:MAG: FAD-dependent oxidoreductase [Bryobacterales bacterium]|nr:FAD-dependent oxidoreductase [Bryobacterales bacterium]MBV9396386.1 FAD-dependent oxidoreductase [Bryobacterales bacterium]
MSGAHSVAILGAGPAGLGLAYRLSLRRKFDVTVLERGEKVGGNAASFPLCGMRVDFGSHRLHPSCAPEILEDLRSFLGPDLLDRPRHGRIRLRNRWVHFPLKPLDLAAHLPITFLAGVGVDGIARSIHRGEGETFADVLQAGLGKTICRDFYFPYARKIWGCDPAELDGEQARRRVSAGSLSKMIRKVLQAVPGLKRKGSGRFFYPRQGFGSISESYAGAALREGVKIKLLTSVGAVETVGGRVRAVQAIGPTGQEWVNADHVCSTIPISQLLRVLHPAAPDQVLASACGLQFRAMILVYLVLETEQFTEFDAHYFPNSDIAVTRLSEPKNYGLADFPGRTILCAELPCSMDDPIWRKSDVELGGIVKSALEAAEIPIRSKIAGVCSRRLPHAYPIYLRGYKEHFARMDQWLQSIQGLVTFGRQGLFAHDNTHHALAMAYAVDECLGEDGEFNRELWSRRRHEFQKHVVED